MQLIIHRISPESIREYFTDLRQNIETGSTFSATRFVRIADKTVRIIVHDADLNAHISHSLACILEDDCPGEPDFTIIAYLTHIVKSEPEVHNIVDASRDVDTPAVTIDRSNGKLLGYDREKACFYYGIPVSSHEKFALEGHIFFKLFYRMLMSEPDRSVIHGACVGLDGNGVLLCAKGNRGKSTLSVLALLEGFEYVSDDYLVIGARENGLYASPIYSIMTLSPTMYNEMYDELEGTRFISNNWNSSKYIISIANRHSQFRWGYPVKVCMLPQIVSDPEPSILPCTQAEKGCAIANLVHSTTTQMDDSFNPASKLKIMRLITGHEFYKILLCRDIRKNVECLRSFLQNLTDKTES